MVKTVICSTSKYNSKFIKEVVFYFVYFGCVTRQRRQ